jgi:hypothetical protein
MTIKLSDLRPGMVLRFRYEGSICLETDRDYEVKADAAGALFVSCGGGLHYLRNLTDDDGDTLPSFKLKPAEAPAHGR